MAYTTQSDAEAFIESGGQYLIQISASLVGILLVWMFYEYGFFEPRHLSPLKRFLEDLAERHPFRFIWGTYFTLIYSVLLGFTEIYWRRRAGKFPLGIFSIFAAFLALLVGQKIPGFYTGFLDREYFKLFWIICILTPLAISIVILAVFSVIIPLDRLLREVEDLKLDALASDNWTDKIWRQKQISSDPSYKDNAEELARQFCRHRNDEFIFSAIIAAVFLGHPFTEVRQNMKAAVLEFKLRYEMVTGRTIA